MYFIPTEQSAQREGGEGAESISAGVGAGVGAQGAKQRETHTAQGPPAPASHRHLPSGSFLGQALRTHATAVTECLPEDVL